MLGDKPAEAGWVVSVSRSGYVGEDTAPVAHCWIEAQTDADGKFVATQVIPARVHICPAVRDGTSTCSVIGQGTGLDLQPGQTATITLGGEGRPVTGRLVSAEPAGADIDWSKRKIHVRIDAPHIGFPGDEQMWKAQAAFLQAAGGDRYRQEVVPAPDGHFRIARLPQGDYEIDGVRLGGRQGRFEVKPMEGGKSDEPVDLGDLKELAPPK